MDHSQPQGYQYSMPCVEETSIGILIPNMIHDFVDCLCKRVRWKINVEVLLFLMIFSVIDPIEASWHWFCAWYPWEAIPVRVWVSFSILWQEVLFFLTIFSVIYRIEASWH